MNDKWKSEIALLLSQCRIGFLATQGKQGPETSMAPYAIYQGNILLHLSRLAKHTGNIANHPQAGLMICTPETLADSALALPRLSLQGDVAVVAKNEYDDAKATYLQSIPDAAPLFEFADFSLFKLTISNIHWVGGFGSARNISVNSWNELLSEHQGNSE